MILFLNKVLKMLKKYFKMLFKTVSTSHFVYMLLKFLRSNKIHFIIDIQDYYKAKTFSELGII